MARFRKKKRMELKNKKTLNGKYNRELLKADKKHLEIARKYIVNVSDYKLSDIQIKMLAKGLKFIPKGNMSNKKIKKQVLLDFREFSRKLKCKAFFNNIEENWVPHPFYQKSYWEPPIKDLDIEEYCSKTETLIKSMKIKNDSGNFSEEEYKAIEKLRNNDNIVIKKADKNSTICIQNKESYIKEAIKQLEAIHYRETEFPDLENLKDSIMKIIHEMWNKEQLDKQTYEFLKKTEQVKKIGTLYLLPKLHKFTPVELDSFEREGLGEKTIPSRPIISLCNTISSYVGAFLDLFLVPLVQKQDTYIQDTPDFIRKIENLKLEQDCFLVTYDITSMYTNIRFEDILHTMNISLPEWLSYGNLPSIHKDYVIKLLKIIIENNYFEFNNKVYIQTIGVGMGQITSPEVSDSTIDIKTKNILSKFNKKDQILFHGRYRDDGFMIFKNNFESIQEFFEIANNEDELLKYKFEISKEKVTFLDTEVYKGERFIEEKILDIKTYRKPTETYQYLHRSSHHPKSTFKGFIKGECTRYIRTNSTLKERKLQINFFKNKLINRSYKLEDIEEITNIETEKERKPLLQLKKKQKENTKNKVMFTTTFHKGLTNINKILKKNWHILKKSEENKVIFNENPMVSYRRKRNIREMLIRSKLQNTNM